MSASMTAPARRHKRPSADRSRRVSAQRSSAVATSIDSPIGPLFVAATDDGICWLEFDDARKVEDRLADAKRRLKLECSLGSHPLLSQLRDELRRYFAGRLQRFTVPLDVRVGTAFQRKAWQMLRQIPYGQTWSYERLAAKCGSPGAQRAAGQANGRNCIAIVIPCHRVINKSGKLGGFGGELWRKEFLLRLERGEANQE